MLTCLNVKMDLLQLYHNLSKNKKKLPLNSETASAFKSKFAILWLRRLVFLLLSRVVNIVFIGTKLASPVIKPPIARPERDAWPTSLKFFKHGFVFSAVSIPNIEAHNPYALRYPVLFFKIMGAGVIFRNSEAYFHRKTSKATGRDSHASGTFADSGISFKEEVIWFSLFLPVAALPDGKQQKSMCRTRSNIMKGAVSGIISDKFHPPLSYL